MKNNISMASMLGSTLIEVLVTLLVLSCGFLAIAHLQIISIRHTQSAYFTSVAQTQLQNMAECLQLQRIGYPCSIEKIAWEKSLSERLPQGMGKIFQKGTHLQIIVAWNDAWIGHIEKRCPSGVPTHLICRVMEVVI
jgi:hypothetical protein